MAVLGIVTNGPALQRRRLGEGDFRHVALLPAEREILSQRVEGIAIPHQDAAQIRMPWEADAHHVENLALVPVCGRPDRRDGGDLRIVLRGAQLEAEGDILRQGVKLIDQFEARVFAHVIDAGDIDQEIEPSVSLQKRAISAIRSRSTRKVVSPRNSVFAMTAEFALEGGDGLGERHGDVS